MHPEHADALQELANIALRCFCPKGDMKWISLMLLGSVRLNINFEAGPPPEGQTSFGCRERSRVSCLPDTFSGFMVARAQIGVLLRKRNSRSPPPPSYTLFAVGELRSQFPVLLRQWNDQNDAKNVVGWRATTKMPSSKSPLW